MTKLPPPMVLCALLRLNFPSKIVIVTNIIYVYSQFVIFFQMFLILIN